MKDPLNEAIDGQNENNNDAVNQQKDLNQPESPLSQNSQFLAFVAGKEERSDSQLWNDLVGLGENDEDDDG